MSTVYCVHLGDCGADVHAIFSTKKTASAYLKKHKIRKAVIENWQVDPE